MTHVHTRPARDEEGRRVDIHVSKLLYVHWFVEGENLSRQEFARVARQCIDALGAAGNKRANGRDESFYQCRIISPVTEDAGKLIGFGLSSSPGWEAAKEIGKQIPKTWKPWDSESVYPYDLEVLPIGRYDRGRKILYTDYAEAPLDAANFESRSAVFRVADRGGSAGSPFRAMRTAPPTRQSLQTYHETELDLLNFMMGISHAGTYVSLRRELKKQFGLTVREFDEDTERRGFVRVDWVFRDLSCDVAFHVNKGLDPRLKYVVLAHELGHYLTQFPFMLVSQLIEQCSWYAPDYEIRYRRLIEQEMPDQSMLEAQANRMASYLLVPGRYDKGFPVVIRSTTRDRGYSETLTHAQHVWFRLQPLFPETRGGHDYRSWSELSEGLERRDHELGTAPGNDINDSALYETMLAATLTRNTPQGIEESKDAFRRVFTVLRKVFEPDFRRPFSGVQMHSDQGFVPPDLRRSDRLFVKPLAPEGSGWRRFPLTPAGKSQYRSALDPSAGARTLRSWQAYFPDLAMVIYPGKYPPSKSLIFDPLSIRLGFQER